MRHSDRFFDSKALRRRGALVALVATTVLLGGSSGHAQIHRQVGDDGVISFSNTKSKKKKYPAKVPRARPAVSMPAKVSGPQNTRYDQYIREAASLYQIPEELVRAVIKVESGFDPRAVSPANAQGLMQLIPETAERMMVTDVFDPRQNIFGGVRYLRVLANLFNGDLELTVAGYNAGENAVIRYGGIPPFLETQDYVVKVLAYYRQYRLRGRG